MPRVTPGVVLVPVDTEPCYAYAPIGHRLGAQAQRLPVQGIIFVQAAHPASLATERDIGAGHDAVVHGQGADKWSLVVLVSHVVWTRQTDTCGPGSGKAQNGENQKEKQKSLSSFM